MHQRIEIRSLVYFLKLAEHASISAAAEALGMAQPSLSHSISRLELALGAKLVVRSARGVELTAAGVVLAEESRALVASLDTVTERVRSIGQINETVRIALVPAIAQVLTVPLAETAEVDYPGVLFQVTQGLNVQILQMLVDERADIGCVYELGDPAVFVSYPLMTEELFLITAPDNWPGTLDASGQRFEPVPLARLEGLPFVMPSNMHGARNALIERFMERKGVRPRIVMQIDSMPQIVEVVERASAYTILPHSAVVNQLAAGRVALVPIRDARMTRTAYLVRKRAKPLNENTTRVLGTLAKVTDEVARRLGLAVTMHPTSLMQAETP